MKLLVRTFNVYSYEPLHIYTFHIRSIKWASQISIKSYTRRPSFCEFYIKHIYIYINSCKVISHIILVSMINYGLLYCKNDESDLCRRVHKLSYIQLSVLGQGWPKLFLGIFHRTKKNFFVWKIIWRNYISTCHSKIYLCFYDIELYKAAWLMVLKW